ncbi:hypothetical protein NON00_02445 [Roseomonas sp. GC11]|uniref:hypothetical protein n=1 Tax=Roseomonas sp. GC11 TaxID=2950546 RepID=UPI00210C9D45|nr:hypothetical protein [Roseomonas sp. GC11]MCQ4158787.1 hypothetical protein [Roseomonas sp. GC11]
MQVKSVITLELSLAEARDLRDYLGAATDHPAMALEVSQAEHQTASEVFFALEAALDDDPMVESEE